MQDARGPLATLTSTAQQEASAQLREDDDASELHELPAFEASAKPALNHNCGVSFSSAQSLFLVFLLTHFILFTQSLASATRPARLLRQILDLQHPDAGKSLLECTSREERPRGCLRHVDAPTRASLASLGMPTE